VSAHLSNTTHRTRRDVLANEHRAVKGVTADSAMFHECAKWRNSYFLGQLIRRQATYSTTVDRALTDKTRLATSTDAS